MPRYVILAEHTADICPTSNGRGRARAVEGMGQQLQTLAAGAGITYSTGRCTSIPGTAWWPWSTHRASRHATGLSQWNTVEVCPATPVASLLAKLDDFPIVFE